MKSILFDLDGTLLPMDPDVFTKGYFGGISGYAASIVSPDKFIKAILNGTNAMVANETDKYNMEVFRDVFLPELNLEYSEIFLPLEEYYRTDFKKLIKCTNPSPIAPEIVQAVLDKGYKIILATNALFPREAVEERMRWANIDKFPWAAITDYEITKGCKPNLKYYQYIVDQYDVTIEGSWMIGNDTCEDLVAKEIGFKTYLVTDTMVTDGKEFIAPDAQGSLEDCLRFVKEVLPKV